MLNKIKYTIITSALLVCGTSWANATSERVKPLIEQAFLFGLKNSTPSFQDAEKAELSQYLATGVNDKQINTSEETIALLKYKDRLRNATPSSITSNGRYAPGGAQLPTLDNQIEDSNLNDALWRK